MQPLAVVLSGRFTLHRSIAGWNLLCSAANLRFQIDFNPLPQENQGQPRLIPHKHLAKETEQIEAIYASFKRNRLIKKIFFASIVKLLKKS